MWASPQKNRMDLPSPLLGSWRTTGQVFEDDGETVAGLIVGFDHNEAPGGSRHFGANGPMAHLRFTGDGSKAPGGWERRDDSGAGWQGWMHLTLTRQ